jgi:hypothetical protein
VNVPKLVIAYGFVAGRQLWNIHCVYAEGERTVSCDALVDEHSNVNAPYQLLCTIVPAVYFIENTHIQGLMSVSTRFMSLPVSQ